MIVYVEYVIFDNFFLDLLIGIILCECLLLSKYKAVCSALLGTALALIYPLIEGKIIFLYKILALLTCSIPFVGRDVYSLIKASLIYLFISSIFSGLTTSFLGISGPIISVNDGLKVGFLSICGIVGFISIKGILRLIGKKVHSGRLFKLTLYSENKTISAIGFMDSGNIAVARDGKGIVFLDKKLSDRLKGDTVDYIIVNTVGGSKIYEIIKLEKVEIYFGGQNHIYKNVNAAKTAQRYNGFEILLSTKLKENAI